MWTTMIKFETLSQSIFKMSAVVLLLTYMYRQVSNISRTLVVNYIVDHSDVVGASHVGVAPTTSTFST